MLLFNESVFSRYKEFGLLLKVVGFYCCYKLF